MRSFTAVKPTSSNMDVLAGQTLLRKKGNEFFEVSADDELKDVKLLGLYYSNPENGPSWGFAAVLAKLYTELNEKGAAFEVIFISNTDEEEANKKYMLDLHGDWLAVPSQSLGDLGGELEKKYKVLALPRLVILKDGELAVMSAIFDSESGLTTDEIYEYWMNGVVPEGYINEYEDPGDEGEFAPFGPSLRKITDED